MKQTQSAQNPAKSAKPKPTPQPKNASLEAEEESAAAHDEPMGSIAAAVPGSDSLAQDAIETPELPGAEAPEIRGQPATAAGTEDKLKDGETETGGSS